MPSGSSVRSVKEYLAGPRLVTSVELRPPRSDLDGPASMDVWIDMYHAVHRLVREDTLVFLTDNAVGAAEEENLGHLTANLGTDVSRTPIVPFLTCKHPLDYCLMYARRAASFGFRALTVVGGDRTVGPARCVPHAFHLRREIRAVADLELGGWANPHADAARQVAYLLEEDGAPDFFLTQVVSHHDLPAVERFLEEADRQGLTLPGVFGVFYYRSGNRRTLDRLRDFFPVPEAIADDFAAGGTAEDVCLKSITALRTLGVRHVYVSNLSPRLAARQYRRLRSALSEG